MPAIASMIEALREYAEDCRTTSTQHPTTRVTGIW